MCTGVESVVVRARLRSVTAGKLLVPTIDTVTVGRRGFYYACPATWNSPPPHLSSSSSSSKFLVWPVVRHVNVIVQFQETAEDITVSLTYVNTIVCQ